MKLEKQKVVISVSFVQFHISPQKEKSEKSTEPHPNHKRRKLKMTKNKKLVFHYFFTSKYLFILHRFLIL